MILVVPSYDPVLPPARVLWPSLEPVPHLEGQVVRLVFLSDTHGWHEQIDVPDGDVLIHAGDFCNGTRREAHRFAQWFLRQPHPHKIVIAGNHDVCLEKDPDFGRELFGDRYLFDREVHVAGLRVYGSPWQPAFCDWAFNLRRGAPLRAAWAQIPEGLDVLITHGPPHGILDKTERGPHVGCEELAARLSQMRSPPRLHVFGHIHEGAGWGKLGKTMFVNASVCTVTYQPTNPVLAMDFAAVL